MKVFFTSILLTISILLLNLSSIDAFAAGKKNKVKGRKGSKNIVGKGFGASNPQLSVEEVVAKFPNRIPPNASECECPCGTFAGKLYRDCCEPFHSKEKLPSSPIDVLRSRYTAFVVRFIYIIDLYFKIFPLSHDTKFLNPLYVCR